LKIPDGEIEPKEIRTDTIIKNGKAGYFLTKGNLFKDAGKCKESECKNFIHLHLYFKINNNKLK